MNRTTAILIAVIAIVIGGYQYWSGAQEVPSAEGQETPAVQQGSGDDG